MKNDDTELYERIVSTYEFDKDNDDTELRTHYVNMSCFCPVSNTVLGVTIIVRRVLRSHMCKDEGHICSCDGQFPFLFSYLPFIILRNPLFHINTFILETVDTQNGLYILRTCVQSFTSIT